MMKNHSDAAGGERVLITGGAGFIGSHQDGARSVAMRHGNWGGIDVVNAHERDPDACRDGC